jgi:hypothetical protein
MMAGTLPGLPGVRTRDITFAAHNHHTHGPLSVDATRELTKCANGELVSHEIVRDGIDALLQLRRASYSASAAEAHHDWTPQGQAMRTRPEAPLSAPCAGPAPWTECAKMEESSDDEEADEELDDCSSCRSTSPVPKRRQRPVKQNPSNAARRRVPPPPKKRGRPPAVRPPTVCSPRNARDPLFVVPDSPKSKESVESESKGSDAESDEVLGPAVLHFSCLQCHKAKKRCNRTKPCSRCLSRGMEDDCRYPDKHDPRSVLRACLRCWQTKKKCDRKQPGCGKCDKVGVKCVYRRESQDSGEVLIYPGYYIFHLR